MIGQKERLELIYDRDKAHEYRTVLDQAYSRTHHSYVVTNLLGTICPKEKTHQFSVLDLGCGTGRYFHLFRQAGSVTGIDISRHMIDEARERLATDPSASDTKLHQADILEYEIPKGSYDLIVSIGTLGEYCPLTSKVVQDIAAGLRPGGVAILSVFDADHCLRTKVRAMYRKEPLASMFDKVQPVVPSKLRKTYSRLFYSHYIPRRELERMLSEQEDVGTRIGRLSCPRHEWDGTHLLAMIYKPPIVNGTALSKFEELLECKAEPSVRGSMSHYIVPSIIVSMAELDQLVATLSECGAF